MKSLTEYINEQMISESSVPFKEIRLTGEAWAVDHEYEVDAMLYEFMIGVQNGITKAMKKADPEQKDDLKELDELIEQMLGLMEKNR